jgi:hypothetical protein
LQVGEVLDARYEVFACKGKGAFSTVLRRECCSVFAGLHAVDEDKQQLLIKVFAVPSGVSFWPISQSLKR